MDTRRLRQNRAHFPPTELARYRGQWVAFSMDGRRLLAGAGTLGELDATLVALEEDPEKVALEFLGCEDSYLGGAAEGNTRE
jgi:hypothetical protein